MSIESRTKRLGLIAVAVLAVVFSLAVFAAGVSAPANAATIVVTEQNSATYQTIFNQYLDFNVTATNAASGSVYATSASGTVVNFQLTPKNASATTISMYYLESDQSTLTEEQKNASETLFGWTAVASDGFFSIDNIGRGTAYDKFVFFKSVTSTQDASTITTYVYNHPDYINLKFDSDPSGFKINSVTATYGEGAAYDTSSAASFTNKDITFTVNYTTDPGSSDSVIFYYSLDAGITWRQAESNAILVNSATFAATDVKAIDSNVLFKAKSSTGKELDQIFGDAEGDGDTALIKVRFDAEQPSFGLTADGYQTGEYSATPVTYYLTPENDCLSDVSYYYYTTSKDNSTEIVKQSGVYKVVIDTTVTGLNFYAQSSAGETYTKANHDILIDAVTPVIEVSAVDFDNTVITNGGSAKNAITFTVRNNAANTSKVSYLYSTDGGVNYTKISAVQDGGDSFYRVSLAYTARNAYFDGSYKFKLVSGAGLSSAVVTFDFSVESSTFDFDMKDIIYTVDTNGWVSTVGSDGKPAIPVTFRVASNGRADRFLFYYNTDTGVGPATEVAVTQDGYVDAVVDGVSVRYYNYVGYVRDAFVASKLNFFVYNRAGTQSNVISSSDNINIDSFAAQVDIDGYIVGGSATAIEEGSWVDGKVKIVITPQTGTGVNVSGFKAYAVFGAAEQELSVVGGRYELFADTTRLHTFKFVTGAGVTSTHTYQVNIDTSGIALDSAAVYVADSRGNYPATSKTVSQLEATEVATKVKIIFTANSEQTGHFDVHYRTSADGVYAQTVGNMFELDLSAFEGKGSITYYFRLVSQAVNAAGVHKTTATDYTVTINYNRLVADVTVERVIPNEGVDWSANTVRIRITNTADVGDGDFVYQIAKGTPSNWTTLDVSSMESSTLGDVGNTYMAYIYVADSHFNGVLYFRALNSAGYEGAIAYAEIAVKVDVTVPDVLRAVTLAKTAAGVEIGSVTTASGSGETIVYSQRNVTLSAPTEDVDQYLPTLFFAYRLISGSGSAPSALPTVKFTDGELRADALNGWTKLGTSATEIIEIIATAGLSDTVVYLYATNGIKSSGTSGTRVTFTLDSTTPSFSVTYPASAGSSPTAGASFEYTWATVNRVQLSAASTTPVFYQYTVDNGATWLDLNAEVDVNGNVLPMSTTNTYTYSFTGSVKASAQFRVVNLAGAVVVFARKAELRVDNDSPSFTLVATSGGADYVSDTWTDSFISFQIRPDYPENNPGGVLYQYRFVAAGSVSSSDTVTLQSLNFTSNNIVGLTSQGGVSSGNGVLTVIATSIASTSYGEGELLQYSRSINIKIDALAPDFDIAAYYNQKDNSPKAVASGDWVNADHVYIGIANLGSAVLNGARYFNVSAVTLTYKIIVGADAGASSPYTDEIIVNSETKIRFTAVSQSGKTVTKDFAVNIDTQAPEIKSYIQNMDESGNIHTYFVDQRISWLNDDDTTASSTLNGIYFANGDVVTTERIDLFKYTSTRSTSDPEYGRCELVVVDKAGNTTTWVFYMRPFTLTVQNITLSEADRTLLSTFYDDIALAKAPYTISIVSGGITSTQTIHGAALTPTRVSYFDKLYENLTSRLDVLTTEINSFRYYLYSVAGKTSTGFTLQGDYSVIAGWMAKYDEYATWKQNAILYGVADIALISGDTFTAVGGATYSYTSVFNTVSQAYAKLNVLMDVVRLAEQKATALPATKVVEADDYEDILKAYDAYSSLTGDQKAMFSTNLYTKLIDDKARCELLLMQNAELGVEIQGENIATGVRLVAQNVSSTTDDYINIQAKILSGIAATEPRAVTGVYKLSLTGENSENPTGAVTIKLAIPESYRNYTKFAVYKSLSDGTVVRMEGVLIEPDGKSVTFESDSLGTYALAANANVQAKTAGDKVYGTILGIEVDGKMLAYIGIGAGVLFALLIVLVVITAVRRRRFLNRYDKKHRYGLAARGIAAVPKGNAKRRRNPLKPDEYVRQPRPDGVKLDKEPEEQKK